MMNVACIHSNVKILLVIHELLADKMVLGVEMCPNCASSG